jgi:hypothetical protein
VQTLAPNAEFHIPTSWRVRGTTARVYGVLSKALEFVRWWPEVYLAVREPVFVANRVWAMRRGFEGLQRELARS